MAETNSSMAVRSAPRTLSTAMLSGGFSLTGAGTVMLGVLLPTLSQQWGLRDDQAGLLLFLQFFASGLGAIVTGLTPHPFAGDRLRTACGSACCSGDLWIEGRLCRIFLLRPGPWNGDDGDQPVVFRSMGRRSCGEAGMA